jgi:hypothetical protein
VNQTQKLHEAAVSLLERLGVDFNYVQLERRRGEYFIYRAWNTPTPQHNGSPPIIKRGRIRVSP